MIDIISYLSRKELIDSLLIGLIAIMIQKSFSSTYIYIQNFIFSHKKYTVSGIWLSEFKSCENSRHNYELVRIIQNQEILRLYIEHYSSTSNNIVKLKGSGIFRGSKISSIYYSLNKSDILSGALILRSVYFPGELPYLKGKYTEFGSKDNEEILYNEDYVLYKIKLPIIKHIKINLHMQCFRNYKDIHEYYIKNYSSIIGAH